MATLTAISGLGADHAGALELRWNLHTRLSDCINLVRRTGAKTVLPAFCDARHVEAWGSAFAPASLELKGPVAL